ncbi:MULTISPECIES: helix-turn-helix domain-containing protein [Sphingomonadales]|uniref:helix-turn-helix domain-containing protein n=1 Tax=Sphingomonadales TaxID=204457 RepID=UPI00082F58D8|nr:MULTISPECIES: helix-turn-helix domain-containing protein [Sphingomonadales]
MNHAPFAMPVRRQNGQPGRAISADERAEIIRLLEINNPPLPFARIARLTRRSIESISEIARKTGHANSLHREVAMFAHECAKIRPVRLSGYATRMGHILHALKQMSGIPPRRIVGPPRRIVGPARSQTISIARQPAILAATRCGLSLSIIGKAMNGRNHTTIRHARMVAEYYYERDANYRTLVDRLVEAGGA